MRINLLAIFLFVLISFTYFSDVSGTDIRVNEAMLKVAKGIYKDYPDSARFIILSVLENAEGKKQDKILAKADYLRGQIALNVDHQYDIALGHYYNALMKYEKIQDVKGISKSLNCLALCNFHSYRFSTSIEYYKEELIYREQINDFDRIPGLYSDISLAYGELHNYDSAIYYMSKAFEFISKYDKKNRRRILSCQHAMGAYHTEINKYTEALSFYFKAQKLAIELNDSCALAHTYQNIATVHLYQGEVDTALLYYKETLLIEDFVNDDSEVLITYQNLANLYESKSDNETSLEYLELASKLNFNEVNPIRLTEIFEDLSIRYKRLGDFDKMSKVTDMSIALSKKMAPITEKHDILVEKYKTEQIANQYEIAQLEAKETKYLYYISGFVSAIAFLIVILIIILFVLRIVYSKKETKSRNVERLMDRDRFIHALSRDLGFDIPYLIRMLEKKDPSVTYSSMLSFFT